MKRLCIRWANGRTIRQSVNNKEYYKKKSFKHCFVLILLFQRVHGIFILFQRVHGILVFIKNIKVLGVMKWRRSLDMMKIRWYNIFIYYSFRRNFYV